MRLARAGWSTRCYLAALLACIDVPVLYRYPLASPWDSGRYLSDLKHFHQPAVINSPRERAIESHVSTQTRRWS